MLANLYIVLVNAHCLLTPTIRANAERSTMHKFLRIGLVKSFSLALLMNDVIMHRQLVPVI